MSTKPLLANLVARGKPLAEVQVVLADGQDPTQVAAVLDSLAPDLAAELVPTYVQRGEPFPIEYEIRVNATREALERLFGWKLRREHLPRWDQAAGRYDGVWPDSFFWEELCAPAFYPAAVTGRVRALGLTQPGAGDNGKDDSLIYSVKEEG